MITSLFFIQLLAFQIWYVTSDQAEHAARAAYVRTVLRHKQTFRIAGIALMLLTTLLFVVKLGWMSGICAGIVGLMCAGNLVVLVNPFRYMNEKGVVALFAFFLVLEFII